MIIKDKGYVSFFRNILSRYGGDSYGPCEKNKTKCFTLKSLIELGWKRIVCFRPHLGNPGNILLVVIYYYYI